MNVQVIASQPFLRMGKPSNSFRQLRKAVIEASGVDFLSKVSDMFRDRNFTDPNPGVSTRSRHKCGDTFSYDQTNSGVVLVVEYIALQKFFRTYVVCKAQDGSQGIKPVLTDVHGNTVEKWVVDFTALAQKYGFERLPEWKGKPGSNYNTYQCTEGLSFAEAMDFLYGQSGRRATVNDVRLPHALRVLGLNDRGAAVRNIQERLAKAGVLPREEVDGVFGQPTRRAVVNIQTQHGLDNTEFVGLVDPQTRALLESLTR